ncbi:MAG: protein kinase, partial [Candidatus Thiodiazotropha sp.]
MAELKLPGYEIGAMLYRSMGRVVYKAYRNADGTELAVETLEAEYPDRQQVAGVRREWLITQRLNEVQGVRKVYDLLPHGSGNLALVGELYEYTLDAHLSKAGDEGLPLVEALEIALQLVRALGGIHTRDIVHKALTPRHVLYNQDTGVIALSGFNIASELDQERQAVQMSRHLEGPLPYISPEQTGRMNRDLDYRSDYYSL